MNRKKSAPFLEAILESPDDDAVRLVFADFLEENGEPERAEFIRIQIAHHQLNEYDPRRRVLGYRIDALLKRFGTKWRAELPKLDGVIWAHFQRGFVHAVYVTNPDVLAECADTIVDASPVDTLILGGGDESLIAAAQDERIDG